MTKIKGLIALIIVVLLVVGGVKLVKKRKQELQSTKTPERPVYVVNAVFPQKGKLKQINTFTGLLKPVNTVTITSKRPVFIEKIYVEIGQPVKKGQLLVKLDSKDITTQLQNIDIDIQNTKLKINSLIQKEKALKQDLLAKENTYRRDLKLFEKKAVPKEKVEKSLSMLELSKANLQEVVMAIEQLKNTIKKLEEKKAFLQNELNYYKIISPSDGIVQNIFLREGDLAVTGKPVLLLETNRYQVDIPVPQGFYIDKSSKIYIFSQKYPVKSFGIYPSSQKSLKIIRAILDKKPENIPSNSYVKVLIVQEKTGTKLPVNAVLNLTDGSFVLVFKDNKFEKIPVTIISEGENYVLVKEKLPELPVAVADESKLRLISAGQKAKVVIKE